MAYRIKTYASIFDMTYGMGFGYSLPKGAFGHLVIRDSNSVGNDYLIVGCNNDESGNLKASIRLNKKQVKQVISACEEFLKRIGDNNGKRHRASRELRRVREDG